MDGNVLPLENVATLRQLQNWTDYQFGGEVDMKWVEYFQGIFDGSGLNVTEDLQIYFLDISSIYGILNLVRETDPDIVKNFILLRIFLFLAPDSDKITREAFKDYYKANNLRHYNRAEYCTRKVIDVVDSVGLSFAASYGFGRYHFNYNNIRKGVELIGKIKDGFKVNVKQLEWLDDVSRDAVLKKIDNIVVSLAYPDLVKKDAALDTFYASLRICGWDHYGNSQRIRSFKRSHLFSEITKTDFWGVSPFEVNAYFIRTNNRIMFPISMLSSRFFHGSNSVLDYSRFVSILSHELAHAVDSSGVGYNADGFPVPLLSGEASAAFNAKKQCFIDQYNSYYVEEANAYVNGTNTLNENFADNAGVKQAFKLFREIAQDVIEDQSRNFTLEQMFFIGYATGWCAQESADYLKTFMSNNPRYPPTRYRVIGALSNLAEFSEAFSCPPRSNMNRDHRCVIW